MKISAEEVKPGKCFVKSHLVREIIQEEAHGVTYYQYVLETGEPMFDLRRTCSKNAFRAWADREATPEELARLKRSLAYERERTTARDLLGQARDSNKGELSEQELDARINAALHRTKGHSA